jgi:hypothetical protein
MKTFHATVHEQVMTWIDREITVKADSPEEARELIQKSYEGKATQEEENRLEWGDSEEILDCTVVMDLGQVWAVEHWLHVQGKLKEYPVLPENYSVPSIEIKDIYEQTQ